MVAGPNGEALIIDNSLETEAFKRVIARKNRNHSIDILDKMIWKKIEEIANE